MFKKKATKKKEVKKVKEFIDGVPTTAPPLNIPETPEVKTDEDAFAEGRSVGYQEGFITSINILNETLQKIQFDLREKIKNQELETPLPPTEKRICSNCGAKNQVVIGKKAFICINCSEASI